MLRRRSQFFVLIDNALSVKAEKEEQKEEEQKEEALTASPFEEYLQNLLQMKTTSAVSEVAE